MGQTSNDGVHPMKQDPEKKASAADRRQKDAKKTAPAEQTRKPALRDEKKRRTIAFCILLLLVLLARAAKMFYNAVSTDVAYPDWVVSAADYLSDALVAARVAAGFALVVRAVFSGYGVVWGTVAPLLAAFTDYALRMIIDLTKGGTLTSVDPLSAVLGLGSQFLLEAVLVGLAFCVSWLIARRRAAAESSRGKKKSSPEKALTLSVVICLAASLLQELIYLIRFLNTYTNITSIEIASIVGTFIRIVTIRGGIAWIAAALMLSFLSKKRGKG